MPERSPAQSQWRFSLPGALLFYPFMPFHREERGKKMYFRDRKVESGIGFFRFFSGKMTLQKSKSGVYY